MAPDLADWPCLAASLRNDGFCVVPGVLDAPLLTRLKAAADDRGERWQEKVGDAYRAQGSMVALPQLREPVFGELIAHPVALNALRRLGPGRGRITFTDGYVISKPPLSPRLFWHFDWYGWTDSSAFGPDPIQVFAMYYLTDTDRQNGCLRVIPRSHRHRHALHDLMSDGHVELSAATDLDRPEFSDSPDEVDVPISAGDLLLGDARLLHAAHANTTDVRRSLVTLWYQPWYDQLPASVRATLAAKTQQVPDTWPADLRRLVTGMQPPALAGAEPLPRTTLGPRV